MHMYMCPAQASEASVIVRVDALAGVVVHEASLLEPSVPSSSVEERSPPLRAQVTWRFAYVPYRRALHSSFSRDCAAMAPPQHTVLLWL